MSGSGPTPGLTQQTKDAIQTGDEGRAAADVVQVPDSRREAKGCRKAEDAAAPGLVGPGVPHLPRPDFAARHPVHVTMRLQPGVGYLRSYQRAKVVEDALRAARDRFGVRIIHYSIQGNHLHLIVEAEGPAALSRALAGAGHAVGAAPEQALRPARRGVCRPLSCASAQDAARGEASGPLRPHELPPPRAGIPAGGLDGPTCISTVRAGASRRGRSCGRTFGLAPPRGLAAIEGLLPSRGSKDKAG